MTMTISIAAPDTDKDRRIQELLEANNAYLERARSAEKMSGRLLKWLFLSRRSWLAAAKKAIDGDLSDLLRVMETEQVFLQYDQYGRIGCLDKS
jgi:hypothetical protein